MMDTAAVDAYAAQAVTHAQVDFDEEIGEWFATVPGIQGAWGAGDSREAALVELNLAVIGWVAIGLEKDIQPPALSHITT